MRQTPGGSFSPKPDDLITYLIDQYRYFNSLAIQGAQNVVDAGFSALEAVLSANPVLSTNPVVADARAEIVRAHEHFDQWCAYARDANDWAFDKLENWVYNDVAPVINQAGESISDWYHKKIRGGH